MTELPRVAAPSAVPLDRLLLDSKLTIPAPRAGLVSRGALIGFARESGKRVVSVTAPSGYGKSSLLAQWASSESRPVAWALLDRFDDDPTALLTLLASAFVRATGADPALVAAMRGQGASALGRSAPHLAAALRASRSPFVMMLDDVHELDTPACHDVLSVVIGGIPEGSQLVTASRSEQPYLPRLRAAGETLEIHADSLALDAAGAQQVFSEASVPLSGELAEAVLERTEGWPVGLYLAAVIARERTGGAVDVSGDDPYVADYLYRESLQTLPEDTQHFLRCTAVLDQFCAELCDALLEGSGSQGRLRELEAANVFIIPLDRRRAWFRYHPLFREFLLGELRRTSPELIGRLHVRAAHWYERNGSPAQAIEHLLKTTATEECLRLVAEQALPAFHAGQVETVHRWVTALGPAAVHVHPPLGVLAGWIAVITGQAAEADRWAAALAAAPFDTEPFDGSATFASGRAMLRVVLCSEGPLAAAADAEFALAAEPSWSVWRAQALCLGGEAELLRGDVDAAEAYFAAAASLAQAQDNSDVLVLSSSECALICMDQGRWVEAAARVECALAAAAESHLQDYATSVLALAASARLAMHQGELRGAERGLTRAMRARPVCTYAAPAIATRLRLQLAKCYFAHGDHATARHLMREIDDILLHRPALGALLAQVEEVRALIASTKDNTLGASPLTPAEVRLLPYLQTHLTIPEIGARLFVSRNTVSTEVASIYRKLGVSCRSEAVDRATVIGLLGH